MREPRLAESIVEKVVGATTCPVTVKFRRGYDVGVETAPDFAKRMEAAGASAVAIHGRFAQQFYRGEACWDTITRVKRAVSIPVVGNGDIVDGASAVRMFEETGCDAVMVGRGAQGNPWIFADIRSMLERGVPAARPTAHERMELAKRHARLLSEREGRTIVKMRKHAMWYVAGMRGAAKIRGRLNDAVSYEDFAALFDEIAALQED
jgi:nifR3 family TIM-barrel protein